MLSLPEIIHRLEKTSDSDWGTDVVRSKDGSKNCFFGHLHKMGATDREGSQLWDWFEENVATTYMIYPVNDGSDARYPQTTPKARILSYLRDILSGKEKTTQQLMECEIISSIEKIA